MFFLDQIIYVKCILYLSMYIEGLKKWSERCTLSELRNVSGEFMDTTFVGRIMKKTKKSEMPENRNEVEMSNALDLHQNVFHMISGSRPSSLLALRKSVKFCLWVILVTANRN